MSLDQPPADRGQHSAQDHGELAGPDELAVLFAQLARELEPSQDPDRTLEQIVQAAVQLIPGSEEGSISVVHGRRSVHSQAPSGELAAAVDALQDEVGEGPCLDAVFEQQTVRVADLAEEPRWPRFSARASELGVHGMLSFQLYVDGDNLGALNLYARAAGSFDDESEHIGLLFASHAAIAYSAARDHAGMARNVLTRQLIGQAQGILMERYKITDDQAFALLVRVSQHRNVKLRDVAGILVRSGALLEAG